MNFCAQCGAKVTLRIPEGDGRPRCVCDACGTIHYENPRMVVGTLPVMDDAILLCRRAIEPRRNMWTLPAGWLENGETLSVCATRETFEEAWAKVEDQLMAFELPSYSESSCTLASVMKCIRQG